MTCRFGIGILLAKPSSVCFCNPSSLSSHIRPVFYSCQLSWARKADEPVPALQIWPNLLWNRCPGTLCFSAPCLPGEKASATYPLQRKEDQLTSWDASKVENASHIRSRWELTSKSLLVPLQIRRGTAATFPFYPTCHPAGPTRSSPVSSWFHCFHEGAADPSLTPAMPKWWQFVVNTLRS